MDLSINVQVSIEQARSLYQSARAAGKFYRLKDFGGDVDARDAFMRRAADSQRLALSILSDLWIAAMQLPEDDPIRVEISTYGDDLYDAYQLMG